MKIDIDKVFYMIKQSEYLETDERHTQGFQSGVKTANKSLSVQLEDYIKRNKKEDVCRCGFTRETADNPKNIHLSTCKKFKSK